MQQPFRISPGRLLAWLLRSLTALAVFGTLHAAGVTIAPIPNQVAYPGGPEVVVPLTFTVPPGTESFPVTASDLRNRAKEFVAWRLAGEGTNRALIITPNNLQSAFNADVVTGSVPIGLTAVVAGITNQTTFILSVLPLAFVVPWNFNAESRLSDPVWADFDNDGRLDAIGPNTRGGPLTVRFNTYSRRGGGGAFSPAGILAGGTGVVPADVNGDGYLDMLLLGKSAKPLLLRSKPAGFTFSLMFTAQSLGVTLQNLTGAA